MKIFVKPVKTNGKPMYWLNFEQEFAKQFIPLTESELIKLLEKLQNAVEEMKALKQERENKPNT